MSPLERIRRHAGHRFRSTRLTAVLALVALLLATTAYVAHGFNHELPLSQHSTAQCDFCLHFSGTTGAPEHPGVVGKAPVAAFRPAAVETVRFFSQEHPTHRLPRGPPARV